MSDDALPTLPAAITATRRSAREARGSTVGVWRALVSGLSAGLLLLVIGVAAAVVVVPAATRSVPLSVLSSSMEPTYPVGTLLIVRPVDAEDVRIGDVITYQAEPGDPELVTHRVIALTQSTAGDHTFTTQGDNNGQADAAPVTAAQVQGTVWYSLPLLGYVNSTLGGQQWVVTGAAVVLFGYAGWMVVSAAREGRAVRRAEGARRTVGE